MQDDLGPSMEFGGRDMQVPIYCRKESAFIDVKIPGAKSGDFTPSGSGEVAVLEVFGGQNERCDEHATSTLQGERLFGVVRKIVACKERPDQDEVIKGDLQGGIARLGTSQDFLDEEP